MRVALGVVVGDVVEAVVMGIVVSSKIGGMMFDVFLVWLKVR
jgi:hypothetical protein